MADVFTVDEYWKARRQESSHAACAAMRLAGIDVSAAGVLAIANRAAGRYSDLSIMDALTDYFSETVSLRTEKLHDDS